MIQQEATIEELTTELAKYKDANTTTIPSMPQIPKDRKANL